MTAQENFFTRVNKHMSDAREAIISSLRTMSAQASITVGQTVKLARVDNEAILSVLRSLTVDTSLYDRLHASKVKGVVTALTTEKNIACAIVRFDVATITLSINHVINLNGRGEIYMTIPRILLTPVDVTAPFGGISCSEILNVRLNGHGAYFHPDRFVSLGHLIELAATRNQTFGDERLNTNGTLNFAGVFGTYEQIETIIHTIQSL